jgi:hypothetical protein
MSAGRAAGKGDAGGEASQDRGRRQREINHGTWYAYLKRGCRCESCLDAAREHYFTPSVDHDFLSDLLNDLFPFGLTDDCPARRQQQATA